MKIVVIDNEINIRKGLMRMITEYCQFVSVCIEANGVESGINTIKKEKPDIVFLDVELDDGTGMDILNALDIVRFQLIFITAYDKYAIDAFKFSAIDFLLKPIDRSDLISALEKAKAQISNETLNEQLSVLSQSLNRIVVSDKKIVLKDINSIYFVKVDEIVRCESDGQYTEFHLTDTQKIVVSRSLKEYEELLKPYGFIRPHHSHLVNQNKIARFEKNNGGILIMDTNCNVPVSQRKKAQVLQVLDMQ